MTGQNVMQLRKSRRRARRLCLAACAALALCVVVSRAGAQVEALPPQHWAYDELEHFEARGFIRLHGLRPYSRAEVGRWIQELGSRKEQLSRVEQQRLARLEREFVTGAPPERVREREDPPLVDYREDSWSLAGDAALSGGGQRAIGTTSGPAADGTAWGEIELDFVLRYRDLIAYETMHRATLAEEVDGRSEENRVSSRERNWHGLTSNYQRAYVALETRRLRVGLGRDYIAWGSTRGEELLLSDQRQSIDALQLRLELGRFRLATVTGLLSAVDDRYLGAHRLEIDAGPVLIGLQESVVYVNSQVKPTYLFPLSYYYGNAFNEGSNDNVLLGFDLRWSSPLGKLSGELLVDDFIYDGDPAPNRLGAHFNWARGFAIAGTDLDLRLGYSAISRWTYTHRTPGNYYVHGSLDSPRPELLGHPLGPDADQFRAALQWSPEADWMFTIQAERTRRGEGNFDLSTWIPGDPYDLPFPSGEIQHETRLAVSAERLLMRQSKLFLGGAFLDRAGDEFLEMDLQLRLDF